VRFQRLLGLRNAVAAETLVARVIAIDVSPYFRVPAFSSIAARAWSSVACR